MAGAVRAHQPCGRPGHPPRGSGLRRSVPRRARSRRPRARPRHDRGRASSAASTTSPGDTSSKGLRGHLGALAHGRLTTGSAKILGLAVGGLLAAALVDRRPCHGPAASSPGPVGTLVGGAVVAGSANLVNLLDLRPGRALKATGSARRCSWPDPAAPARCPPAPPSGPPLCCSSPTCARRRCSATPGPTRPARSRDGPRRADRTRGRLVALAVLAGAHPAQREGQLHPGHRVHPGPARARRAGPETR